MSKVCEECWMSVSDSVKHDWEEHGVAPSAEEQSRLARQKVEFTESLKHLDIHLEGTKKQMSWGGTSK